MIYKTAKNPCKNGSLVERHNSQTPEQR